jgi:hypothetical protein
VAFHSSPPQVAPGMNIMGWPLPVTFTWKASCFDDCANTKDAKKIEVKMKTADLSSMRTIESVYNFSKGKLDFITRNTKEILKGFP